MNYAADYGATILVMGLTGLMLLVQLLIADVTAIRAGKTPGTPTEPDHSSFAFRAERAFLNTNESVTIFLLLAAFAMLSSANPSWSNALALGYGIARLLHMLFYYLDLRIARSAVFVLSLLALAGMFATGLAAWL